MKNIKFTKEVILWLVFAFFAIIAILSSTNDLYNFLGSISGVSALIFIISLIVWLINRKKRPEKGHKYKFAMFATLILTVAFSASATHFYSGTKEQKEDIASSMKDSSESVASSISSEKASSESKAKQESKKEAKQDSQKESSEESSARKANAMQNEKDFENLVKNAPQKSNGVIESVTTDNGGSGVNIYLSSAVDNLPDDQLQTACYTLWKEINSAGNSYNISPLFINIYDDGNNLIAKTKAFGGFKYIGMGN